MHFYCPHCRKPVEIVDLPDPAASFSCPSCGSVWTGKEASAATIADTSQQTVGRFQLLNPLGRGQFGEVWSARDPDLDRIVAIKIPRKEGMNDGEVERFLREARAAAQLKHENIVRVHEVGRGENALYIASDLIHGVSLADRLAGGWKPTFAETAQLCATVAEAVHHAHENGVVHRDIKPGNILLDKQGIPFVTDFGLAKRDAAEITMTVEGKILGTPAYMSPEQARGEGHNADRRSDVYSLGVVLFELLTGERPFKGGSQILVHQILNQEPPQPRSLNRTVPKDLQTICLKALEKDPAGRFQSAKEFADELRRYLIGQPITSRPISRFERWRRWAGRNRALAGVQLALGASVLLLGAVAADNWRQRQANRPFTRIVKIDSYPSGARMVFVPLDEFTGEPIPSKKVKPATRTPVELVLPPGDYLVVGEVEGHGFQEVFRQVPDREEIGAGTHVLNLQWKLQGGKVELPAILIRAQADVEKGMVRLKGGRVTDNDLIATNPPMESPRVFDVDEFLIDPTELTVTGFENLTRSMCEEPRQLLDDWGLADDCESGSMKREVDRGRFPNPNQAITVDYHAATQLAEYAGKRLMTEEEYAWATTEGGARKYPWGDQPAPLTDWKIDGAVGEGSDQTPSNPPVYGLFSGVGEWTSSPPIMIPRVIDSTNTNEELRQLMRGARVIRGRRGPDAVAAGSRSRSVEFKSMAHDDVGVRFVRSARPRFLDDKE